ncbi:phosphodiester glycosidase family protein [Dysgonomonas sp. HGC4]|uniref:phosphodiester glycosidase family protein n=1 Tax=Dysgonomonas sp. HGC4 TaxID=1658009 RepID=UPI000683089F|nr:phosphodiester glycosidase family protein [Dysgonomonas sp. HGC4]MBD8348847.1 phosphodiester glycosidase family protein [Dysgonomonas sp. HGC4]
MNRNKFFFLVLILLLSAIGLFFISHNEKSIDDRIIDYKVDLASSDLALYWKNDSSKIIKSIQNLKTFAESKNRELLFAVNGGMYNANNTPQGLYIENFKTLSPIDTTSGSGNFYLKPNGVFYITANNIPVICKTEDFINNGHIKYATQSGPMLIIDGQIHPELKEGSTNLQIRNGVGILPDNRVVFAMSKTKINFYDLAMYFKSQGCRNALYLDGYVSRTYLPEKDWKQTDGDFGVIIGITKPLTN